MDSMGPPVGGGAVAFIICVVCWSHEGGVMWSPPPAECDGTFCAG